MSTLSRIVLIVCALAVSTSLCGLGYWQLQRLERKENLIANVNDRLRGAPLPLAEIETRFLQSSDVDYAPVVLAGVFDHSQEMFFFTTHEGQSGWNVFVPLKLQAGRVVIVNRGFVPAALKLQNTRRQGLVTGLQTIEGLARNPDVHAPNAMIPENEPEKRIFFWKSLSQMALAAKLEADAVVPFFVDAGPAANPGGWPKGGTTIIAFTNNHLQYALTWLGLAGACLGVCGFLLISKGNSRGAKGNSRGAKDNSRGG